MLGLRTLPHFESIIGLRGKSVAHQTPCHRWPLTEWSHLFCSYDGPLVSTDWPSHPWQTCISPFCKNTHMCRDTTYTIPGFLSQCCQGLAALDLKMYLLKLLSVPSCAKSHILQRKKCCCLPLGLVMLLNHCSYLLEMQQSLTIRQITAAWGLQPEFYAHSKHETCWVATFARVNFGLKGLQASVHRCTDPVKILLMCLWSDNTYMCKIHM